MNSTFGRIATVRSADSRRRSVRCSLAIGAIGGGADKSRRQPRRQGASEVEIRAVHDGETAYFSFVWSDPTRSLKHLPLIKKEDGWHVMQEKYDIGDEHEYHEDKFSVLLTNSDALLAGDRTFHAGRAPAEGKPATLSGRGLHYTSRRRSPMSGNGKPRVAASWDLSTTAISDRPPNRTRTRLQGAPRTRAGSRQIPAPQTTPTISHSAVRAATSVPFSRSDCQRTGRRPGPPWGRSTSDRISAKATAPNGG